MFKIYILSILCAFSLVAMEKTPPENLSYQNKLEEIKKDLDTKNKKHMLKVAEKIKKQNSNIPPSIIKDNKINTLTPNSLSKEEASKIISNIIAILHIDEDPYITNEQIKSFKEALPLIGAGKSNIITWLNLAVKKKQYELVNILIDNGARAPITLIEECIKSPEKHDILRILIRKPILESNYLSANIFDNAIKYELVDVIADFIKVQKWQFTIDNLNQAIDKASSQKSSDIAILLLQNLSHLYERLNKDQAAKYINFIINSDSPKLIYDILIYYRSWQHNITTAEIMRDLHTINYNYNNTNSTIKEYLEKVTKDILNKFNKAIIASLSQLIENNNIDDFKYIYSFLKSKNLQNLIEFNDLIEKAYESSDKVFIKFFLIYEKNINIENYINILNHKKLKNKDKDPFAEEKVTASKFIDNIDPIQAPAIIPQNLEKNLCAIFYNLNEPLAEYLHGYRIKCQYKENKVTIALNLAHDKILNIIYNIITKYRFSAIKDGLKITINISSKDIDEGMLKTLNHDLSDSVTKYIKKQKIIIHNNDEDHHNEIITANQKQENPYKKFHNKNNAPTSWDSFIIKHKSQPQQPKNKTRHAPTNNKQINNKNPKNSKNSKKTVLPQQLSPLTDRNNTKKPYNKFDNNYHHNKFNNNYHLTNDEKINTLSYKSPFLSDDNDNDIIIPNKDIKNSPNNLSITLLSNYYNFFKRISDDNIKEIFNHGIMAIDFSKMKHKTYINNINDGLKNFNNDIIPELNNIYNKFKEKYDTYLTENHNDRIAQIKHLLVWLKEEYEYLIINEDAAKGYLFILGEHLSRLLDHDKEAAIALINNHDLLINLKDFRNAIKHGEDNKIITDEATFVIGEKPAANYDSLLKDLRQEVMSANFDHI